MTQPVDLAALRALIETAIRGDLVDPLGCRLCGALWPMPGEEPRHGGGCPVPAAQEALKRVEAEHRSCVTQFAYDAVCGGNAKQAARLSDLRRDAETFTARLARLESLLERANRFITGRDDLLSAQIAAALECRSTDADAAEFQRVHGGAAQAAHAYWRQRKWNAEMQAARDVAYWRKLAEHAEARLAKLEDRDER